MNFKVGDLVSSKEYKLKGEIVDVKRNCDSKSDKCNAECDWLVIKLQGRGVDFDFYYPMGAFEQIQRVWRCGSETLNSGYFMWEVLEVIGKPLFMSPRYDETPDGSFVYTQCHHTFSTLSYEAMLEDRDMPEQEIVIIK